MTDHSTFGVRLSDLRVEEDRSVGGGDHEDLVGSRDKTRVCRKKRVNRWWM